MRSITIFAAILCLSSTAQSADRPLKIAVFGDSISAGVFATEPQGNPTQRFFSDAFKVAVDAVSATLKKIDLSDTDPANLKTSIKLQCLLEGKVTLLLLVIDITL